MSGEFKGLGNWEVRYGLDGDLHQFWLAPATFPAKEIAGFADDDDQLVWAPVHVIDISDLMTELEQPGVSYLYGNDADDPDLFMIEAKYGDHKIYIEWQAVPFGGDADDDLKGEGDKGVLVRPDREVADATPEFDSKHRPKWADVLPGATRAAVPCRHCRKPIIYLEHVENWVHTQGEAGYFGSRGCRAATYQSDTSPHWDDSIPRSWYAEP